MGSLEIFGLFSKKPMTTTEVPSEYCIGQREIKRKVLKKADDNT